MIALWAAAVYLAQKHKNYWICAIPATFMSAVSLTYFTAAGECLGILWSALSIPMAVYYPVAVAVGIVAALAFLAIFKKKTAKYATMPVIED